MSKQKESKIKVIIRPDDTIEILCRTSGKLANFMNQLDRVKRPTEIMYKQMEMAKLDDRFQPIITLDPKATHRKTAREVTMETTAGPRVIVDERLRGVFRVDGKEYCDLEYKMNPSRKTKKKFDELIKSIREVKLHRL